MKKDVVLLLATAVAITISLASTPPLLAHPSICKLTPVGDPKLLVDPTCATCDGGILDVYFRNVNRRPIPLLVTVDQNVVDSSGQPVKSVVNHSLVNPSTNATYDETKRNALGPGELLLVRLTISNIREEGEWQGKIYNRGLEAGIFHVYRRHAPFSIKLDVANPDQPELTFRNGQPLTIPLQNEDNYSYRLKLEFVVKGISAVAPDVTLPPKGSTVAKITYEGSKNWFDHDIQGKFKDETVEGRLILTQVPVQEPCRTEECQSQQEKTIASVLNGTPYAFQSVTTNTRLVSISANEVNSFEMRNLGSETRSIGPRPDDVSSKVIRATVHLSYYDRPKQYLYIGLLLLAGAGCSLLLNAYLPNQARRIDLKRSLDWIASRIRSLPMMLASRVRVSLGLEERRCIELLSRDSVIHPGFSAVVTDVTQRVEHLTKRVELAEELGRLRIRFESERERSLFPTPMNLVEDEFEQADDLLRKVEFAQADQSAAEQLAQSLETRIENLEDISKFYAHQHDQVEQITTRARLLLQDGPETTPGTGLTWPSAADAGEGQQLYQRMYSHLLDLLRKAQAAQPIPAAPQPIQLTLQGLQLVTVAPELFLRQDLSDADRLTTKMEMLRDCARLQEGALHLKNLAELLLSQNSEKFDAARRLLEQVKEKVYSAEAIAEIQSGVSVTKVRDFRDWGGGAIWRRLLSLSLFVFLVVAIYSVMGEHLVLLLLLIAFVTVVAGLGDIPSRLASLVDWRLERSHKICKANPQKIRVDCGTNEVRVYEPVQLTVRFCREPLNSKDVLEDITPMWDFGHDNLALETGWELTHYFPRDRKYTVKVKFQKRSGGFLSGIPPSGEPAPEDPHVYVITEINAKPVTRVTAWAFVLDIVWLFVALAPAVAALFAGAIEQLNKLDLVPAMVAIFLLGFGSEQVKNLIQKSQ